MTWHWASRMTCKSLQFILFASYHCLVHREFDLLINFLNWTFNISKSLLTVWSVILELLLVPVSLHCFHTDYNLYTSNLELLLQLTISLNSFLSLLYLSLWHSNLNTAKDFFLYRLVFTTFTLQKWWKTPLISW